MDSTQTNNPVAQKSMNQSSKRYLVFKDLSRDPSNSALLRVGAPSAAASGSGNNAGDRDSAVKTWEFPVADVLDQINWAFTEALYTDDLHSTSPSESLMPPAAQSEAIECEARNSEYSAFNKIPVDDLLAQVDNLFDNPLNFLNPISPQQREERAVRPRSSEESDAC